MELARFGGDQFLQPTLETICCSRFHDVREVFNNQLFSTTVVEEKSMTLMQEDMTLADYHAQFLAL